MIGRQVVGRMGGMGEKEALMAKENWVDGSLSFLRVSVFIPT